MQSSVRRAGLSVVMLVACGDDPSSPSGTTEGSSTSGPGDSTDTTGPGADETDTTGPGSPPVAMDDGCYEVLQGQTLVRFSEEGVLANDTSPTGAPLVVSGYQEVSARGGAVSLLATGALVYDPPLGFWGEDSFTYQVGYDGDDQGATAEATVRVVVRPQQSTLSALVDGGQALVIAGIPGGALGSALAGEARIDGDELDDVIFTAPDTDGTDPFGQAIDDAGEVLVLFGTADRTPVTVDELASGSGGFVILGDDDDLRLGRYVAALGRADGDGQIAIGDANDVVTVLRSMPWPSPTLLSDALCGDPPGPGCNSRQILPDCCDELVAVANIGDVGADGVDDLALGFPELRSDRGAVFVVHGSDQFDGDLDLDDLTLADGYRLEGEFPSFDGNTGDRLGTTLSGVGNILGGDAADLLLGATSFGNDVGRAYLVDGSSPMEDTTGIEDIPGHHATGVLSSARLGYRVTGRRGGAHFDSGPLPDYVVSLRPQNEDQRVLVVFSEEVATSFVLDEPALPVLEVEQTGVGMNDPLSLTLWSDLGGDGRDELVMAAPGRITVLYGREFDPASTTTSTGSLDADQGFVILADDPGERLEVAPAGDVDGDGHEDLLVGMPEADAGDGRVYIVYGAAAECTA